jgi:hypothetical protein
LSSTLTFRERANNKALQKKIGPMRATLVIGREKARSRSLRTKGECPTDQVLVTVNEDLGPAVALTMHLMLGANGPVGVPHMNKLMERFVTWATGSAKAL